MTTETIVHEIPGGQALVDWFGFVPHFHDANLLDINLVSRAPSTLVIHSWRITDTVDEAGFLVHDRHAVVTITLDAVKCISLDHFDKVPAIIHDLTVTRVKDRFELAWSGSYGAEGSLQAKAMRIDFTPGRQ